MGSDPILNVLKFSGHSWYYHWFALDYFATEALRQRQSIRIIFIFGMAAFSPVGYGFHQNKSGKKWERGKREGGST